MPRLLPSWHLCRRVAAASVVVALCMIGYRRGYKAEDYLHAGQVPVVVRHKVDDLMGPDFSAAGMTGTANSLILIANSLHQDGANRLVTFNTSKATASFSQLEVTSLPYVQSAFDRLLRDIRKPSRS